MKILSIRQPWAWLIVRPDVTEEAARAALYAAGEIKDVENRGWPTKHRGRFAVHAGLTFDSDGYDWVRSTFPQIAMPHPRTFPRGGIVGDVRLVDCIPPGSDESGRCRSRWYMGEFGFLLANSRPCDFRPCKGRLGFFRSGA